MRKSVLIAIMIVFLIGLSSVSAAESDIIVKTTNYLPFGITYNKNSLPFGITYNKDTNEYTYMEKQYTSDKLKEISALKDKIGIAPGLNIPISDLSYYDLSYDP